VVGVNEFASREGTSVPVFVVDERVAAEQGQRLKALRASRDGAHVTAALEKLKTTAAGRDNLLPPILDAVKAYATIGEICNALRAVFGVHHETVVV